MRSAPTATERERDADRKRNERLARRLLFVPDCADRARRVALEADDEAWLLHYFSAESGSQSPFTYRFTEQQREMIAAIRSAIVDGGDQAIAASRGEGKTTLCERMLLKYTLTGRVGFSVLFAATGSAAKDCLDSIKGEVENNAALAEDYPEVCTPVSALENTPNRAHYQVASGSRFDNGEPYEMAATRFSWCGQEIVFPCVPGSPSMGAIIATRGLDSAVRGIKKKGRRVDVAIIDDPDTEETARSEDQAKKLEDRIDRGIAALGSQRRRASRVILTTLQNRRCVSFRFTDPQTKPSWNGKRYRFLMVPPTNADMWQEYVHLKQADWQNDTESAMQFYVANREAMDAGAVVANPNRATVAELSALQFYYNEVARIGADAVATEYDNDPPPEDTADSGGITSRIVESKVSGLERYACPIGTTAITVGVDVGQRFLNYSVVAWCKGAVGCVVDYGLVSVCDSGDKDRQTVEREVIRALHELRQSLLAGQYTDELGNRYSPSIAFVDSGSWPDAVYQFVRTVGGAPWFAIKGKSPYQAGKQADDRQVGDHWFATPQGRGGLWLYTLDTDHWKRFVHDRFLTPTFDENNQRVPGSLACFVADTPQAKQDRKVFAHQICGEIWTERFVVGKGVRRRWEAHGQNHFLDATYMACAGSTKSGIELLPPVTPQPRPIEQQKPRQEKPTPFIQRPGGWMQGIRRNR